MNDVHLSFCCAYAVEYSGTRDYLQLQSLGEHHSSLEIGTLLSYIVVHSIFCRHQGNSNELYTVLLFHTFQDVRYTPVKQHVYSQSKLTL
jgi:hypothetical protein